jgi:hypothetical protein
MKKILLTIGVVVMVAFAGMAQKYAFVDTEYIMDNIHIRKHKNCAKRGCEIYGRDYN